MKYLLSPLARRAATLLALAGCISAAAATPDPALSAAVANPARNANFVSRDAARHPVEELTFFGITPNMTVVELWPGGGYWTEILGPYLAKGGNVLRRATRSRWCRGGQDGGALALANCRAERSPRHYSRDHPGRRPF